MKKREKFSLDELEVQSFVTSFNTSEGETKELKGGGTDTTDLTNYSGCLSLPEHCGTGPGCDPRETERTPSGCGTEVCNCYY